MTLLGQERTIASRGCFVCALPKAVDGDPALILTGSEGGAHHSAFLVSCLAAAAYRGDAAKMTWRIIAAPRRIGAAVMTSLCRSLGPRMRNGHEEKSGLQNSKSPSRLIDARIKELGDWRGKMLGQLRALIKEADPEIVEEWKWRGVPVWEHDGIICTGETYKSVVKLTFAKGASLADPSSLFNASLEGNTRRAIDFHEGDKINEKALKAFIRAAAALNNSKARR